jgi:hypothetical protein
MIELYNNIHLHSYEPLLNQHPNRWYATSMVHVASSLQENGKAKITAVVCVITKQATSCCLRHQNATAMRDKTSICCKVPSHRSMDKVANHDSEVASWLLQLISVAQNKAYWLSP